MCIRDSRLGGGAAQQPGAERALGLAPGVGPVVRIGPPLVLQTRREPTGGGGELLVHAADQESLEGEGGGHPDGEADERQQRDQPRGELAAQCAWQRPDHADSGFMPTPDSRRFRFPAGSGFMPMPDPGSRIMPTPV